jgi:hypothetical protein
VANQNSERIKRRDRQWSIMFVYFFKSEVSEGLLATATSTGARFDHDDMILTFFLF